MSALRQKALRLLSRREHSRAELARKLAGIGTPEEIEILLADLQQRNFSSDARMADAYLRSHSGRFGVARLRQDLRAKGIAADLIESGIEAAELDSEIERARALWQRKFDSTPGDAREWARQARFLQSRGFSVEIIRKLLRETEE